jgi:hypothetical protein
MVIGGSVLRGSLVNLGYVLCDLALERGVDLGGKTAVEEAARNLVSCGGRDRCVVGDL